MLNHYDIYFINSLDFHEHYKEKFNPKIEYQTNIDDEKL